MQAVENKAKAKRQIKEKCTVLTKINKMLEVEN